MNGLCGYKVNCSFIYVQRPVGSLYCCRYTRSIRHSATVHAFYGANRERSDRFSGCSTRSAIVRTPSDYRPCHLSQSTVSATSDPKGPVYLWARREAMEEEVPESLLQASASLHKWPSIEPTALSPAGMPLATL
jgi:hypothetical protein